MRLFLVDGTPTGLITAEIMNWSGHTLVAPRSRIGEALKREEASRTGIYFLVGDDPDHPSKTRVYIGEGDSVSDRLRSHAKDESKDFWTKVCVVTSKDSNLTKAHARYLESRLIELTTQADRANLANGNEPGTKLLPESDISDMEFFLDQVQIILPVVGMEFLRLTPRQVAVEPSGQTRTGSPAPLELVLESRKHGIEAHALEADGEIIVLSGSKAVAKDDFVANTYAMLRKELMEDGRLKLSPDGQHLEFTEDVPFSSPSAAAGVVFNRNSNGRTAWRLKTTGQTLKDWQDAQIAIQELLS